MSNYTVATNFGAKDALASGNPSKAVLGAELTTEFNAIATMSATKEDTVNKGANNGYAGLDGSGDVPRAQLPTPVAYEDENNAFTAMQTIRAASVDEQLRLGGSGSTTAPFISFYHNDGTTRRGYFQFTATGATWASELTNGNINISTAGTGVVQINGTNIRDTAILTSGTLADARVAQSNVTQHQAALAINTDQLVTDYADDASTSYTLGSGDAESIRRFTAATAITITLPNSIPSGWAVGDSMGIIRGGAGSLTFSTAGTLRSSGGSTITVANGKACVTLAASGVWELSGNV